MAESSSSGDFPGEQNPVDALAEEYASRLRSGADPAIEDYVARLPEHEKEIRLIFPSIRAVEKISSQEADGRKSERDSSRFFKARLESIADFEIQEEIGRGGMGIVYRAHQKSLNRMVALKTIHPLIANSPKQLHRFQREAEAAARLQHTNIIQIYGVGEEDGVHFFAMQLVNGCSLAEMVQYSRGLTGLETERTDRTEANSPPDAALDDLELQQKLETHSVVQSIREKPVPEYRKWVCQVIRNAAEALEYAHSRGILHRDIKPANLLLDQNGTVLISDFGLAKLTGLDDVTEAGDLVGTLRYMSPERLMGEMDQRSDIYSLGLTLFELLTLKPALGGSSLTGAGLISGQRSEVPGIRSLDRTFSRDLETITMKATAAEPAERYQSAGQLGEDLRLLLLEEPIRSRRVSWVEGMWRFARKNPAIASLASVSVVLLLSVALVALAGNYQTNQALVAKQNEYERAEKQKIRAQENLSIAKTAIRDLLGNLSSRGMFQQRSYRFGDEEFVGTTARLTEADIEMLVILLGVFQRFSIANEEDFSLETAEANAIVGDIHQKLGRYEDAMEAYSKSLQQYEEFNADRGNREKLVDQLRIQNEIAITAGLHGNASKAEAAYRSAVAFYEEHRQHLQSNRARFEYARTLNVFASTGSRLGQYFVRDFHPGPHRFPPGPFGPGRGPFWGGKKPRMEKGRDPEPGREGRREARPFHGKMFGKFGHRSRAPDAPPRDPASGQRYLLVNHKAEGILQELIESDGENTDYRVALARNLADRLRLTRMDPKDPQREQTLGRIRSILETLIEENPGVNQFQFELAQTLLNNIYGPPEESRKQVADAVDAAARLMQAQPDVYEYRALFADATVKEAQIEYRSPDRERRQSAEAKFQIAMDAYDEITRAQPDAHQFQLAYVLQMVSIADLKERMRDQKSAAELRMRALKVIEQSELPDDKRSPAGRIKQELMDQLGSRVRKPTL